MSTLFLILLATAAYFAVVSRDREGIAEAIDAEPAEAESLPARNLLTIEVEKDDDGYHSAVIDIGGDAILFVSDSFEDISDAVRASQTWIETNG